MKIILIILAIICLLKFVSLFILLCIETYFKIKKIDIIGIKKTYGIYEIGQWYIIPSFKFSFINKYFELAIVWLKFEYYCCYSIDKND